MDPRPDLSDDSVFWSRLLQAAYVRDGDDSHGLYGALDGLRCLGAQLQPWQGGFRLSGGYIAKGDYDGYRARFLAPHRDALVALLNKAA